MGSFKKNGRDQGTKGRRTAKLGRRRGFLALEALEERQLLSGGSVWHPTTTNLADAQNGPMAPFGTQLVNLYESFGKGQTNSSALAKQFPLMQFQNNSVLVGLTAQSDFSSFVTNLTNLGMQIVDQSATYDLVDGWLPINELPAAAELPQTRYGSPDWKHVTLGAAINEAGYSTFANVAAQQTGLTGAGVTVGVLSDSFNNLGGYATDVSTGDLPANVTVLPGQGGPTTGEDEGRAMSQNIYHIAPGAGLAFATGFGTDLQFGQNIAALASTAGAKVIVDDVGSASDPFFQPGFITQGINQVVSEGVTYLAAAGNESNHGYLSTFRSTSGTVNIGGTNTSGTFMNFNGGSGASSLLLPITVNVANTNINFQFDQPWAAQEPAGGPGPTSQLDFYVLDSSGNIIASGTSNNVATGIPQQLLTVPSTGNYYVAIQLVSGSAPGHVEFAQFGQQSTNDLIVSQQYGTAGGTYYPTSFGHNAAANTIGVGAVPWWAPTPFLAQTPLANEPFSSAGPEIQVFDASGTPLSSAQTIQNPTVTAPDGGNTTFFGFVASTNNPPIPGEPATSTNLYATFTPDQSNLPSFFGTSSAAPNTAAIVAMMLQRVPSATPAQIKQALIASASKTPMNGSAPGAWDATGGYGLVNAINAINAIDVLRVLSTDPANGSTVTVTPSAITVTFSKPVNFSTVSSSDLVFTSAPAGVTVNVGTPIAVDDPKYPTIIAFPFSFSYTNPPTTTANGTYSFIVTNSNPSAPILSEDGKALVPSNTITFTLADVTAPEVAQTSVLSRIVTIQFTKAMNPSTITLANIYVQRQGGTGNWNNPINLNSDPRAKISYNPLTDTATLDYSLLPQTEMPTDDYEIVVKSGPNGVTDLVGNELDGTFTGTFPSGNGSPGDFVQDLGLQQLQAPVVTTFQMTAATDTGIAGDQNTKLSQPQFIGQVYSSFPGTVANLQVYVEFSGLHAGTLTLAVGGGGRGFAGTYDVSTTTDSSGAFTITAPVLPEGFQYAQIVVVGQADQPPLPGYASSQQHAFRIDQTAPLVTGVASVNGTSPASPSNYSSLTSLTFNVQDPVLDSPTYLATPSQVLFPAIDPSTASNISNYSLEKVNADGSLTDESQYITTASFVAGPPTLSGSYIADYNGQISLTFSTGIPAGNYELIVHTKESTYPGLADAAGNPLASDFVYDLSLQSQPVYIVNMAMESTYSSNGSTAIGGPRSYYEVPTTTVPGYVARAAAPPTAFVVDLSNPIPYADPNGSSYSSDVQLIGSRDSSTSAPDGNFGNLGQAGLGSSGTGFSIISSTTVTLYTYNATTQTWAPTASGGSGTRLVLTIAAGTTLPADYYRLYMPNQVDAAGNDTRIYDIYGNQLDGEFLGNTTSSLANTEFPSQPLVSTQFTGIFNYEDQLSSGVYRQGMSGDGVAGGAFMTSFVVVPPATLSATGGVLSNVVFARPGYVEDPLLPSTAPDGSLAKPYPTLAPEGDPNAASQQYPGQLASYNPTHDPNGGLNSSQFFLSGFNSQYDRNGNGVFDRSALYAASQLAFRGPVIVVALPGTPQRNPITGTVTQQTFVLQAPAGSDPVINNASASVPFDTTLVFSAGSTLKLQNASLFVQNQGSALEVLGGSTPSQQVNFTSYNDASIGGASNNNPDTTPRPGDWGGIVFRSYDEAIAANQVQFPVDGITQGITGPAISGEDDGMSIINNAVIQYGGGPVPVGSSNFYSGITLYNARPAITNDKIANTGQTGGLEAAIAANMDSFRQDDEAWGPLIRRMTVTNNSLNGIWLLSSADGFIQPSNAVPYPTNPSTLGGAQNYVFFESLPFVITAQLTVGQYEMVNTGGLTQYRNDRLYIQPGVMMKFNQGSGIDLLNPGASLNIGSRSYITGYDQNNSYGPGSPGFVAESASNPQVLFTSIFDDKATTTLVPNPINVTGETTPTTLAPALWGSIGIQSGALAVINAATFQYGGGIMNTQTQTLPSQSVVSFLTEPFLFPLPPTASPNLGTHVYVTNNNFYNNFDAAMQIEPNGLLAGDPLHPLVSGHPFIHGNVLQGNGIDGMAVVTSRAYFFNPNASWQYIGPQEVNLSPYAANQTVNTVWDLTDITYVLRGTVVLAGAYWFTGSGLIPAPVPNATAYTAPPSPTVSLTIQAALPGTLLADGTTIPNPGASVVVKMLSENTVNGAGSLAQFGSTGTGASQQGGAGFIAGVDDSVDPTPSPLVDPGAYSQIRILGIPGNQTTGQQRVPVVITSLRDGSVGVTARGVKMYNIFNSYPMGPYTKYAGQSLTAPAAGDGGLIYIGSNSLTTYNLTDPRQGSLIDNADISYMTRIEVQGGGIIDQPATGAATDWSTLKTGYGGNPLEQLNTAMAVRISDTNINSFSDAGVFVHPMSANALVRLVSATGATPPARATGTTNRGQGVTLYMYNDTIANTPQGVHVNSESVNDTAGESPMQLVLLNNTFYNDNYGVQTGSPAYNGQNLLSTVSSLIMDNIFDGSSIAAINIQGQAGLTTVEYNLFWNNTVNVTVPNGGGQFPGNVAPVYGNPAFVDAAAGNFALLPTSAAIDAARSEIGPIAGSNAIYPTVNQLLTNQYGIRTDPTTLVYPEEPGADNPFGGFGTINDPRQILTLPGSGVFSFQDEWVPALTTAANSYGGPSTGAAIPGTYNYTPISGQRDILGLIRIDDPNVPNVGYGKYPFFDIGAYEYVNLHPPEVAGVTATLSGQSSPVNFYSVGSKSGANSTPQTIDVQFTSPIDPNSLNAATVLLEALGVSGNNTPDTYISLAGKLSYVSATDTLVINLGGSGLALKTDAYRLILVGSGSQVIASPQGIALDGENTDPKSVDDPNNPQLALPSGDGFPGGNFYDNFIINTTPSSVTSGTFKLAPASDTNIVGDYVTYSTLPSFVGTITEPNTALVPLNGQTAIVDVGIAQVSSSGTTVYFADSSNIPSNLQTYIRENAGTGLTDTNGNFTVTLGVDGAGTGLVTDTSPLPNSPYNVGANGQLVPVPGEDNYYYVARVRIIDQSGNQSNEADPNAQAPFVVDTVDPTVTVTSPVANSVITTSTGPLNFVVDTSQNMDMTHFTTSQIQLLQSAPNGSFTGTGVTTIPINSDITVKYLDSGTPSDAPDTVKGREQIDFSSASTLANGLYQLTLFGTSTDNGVRDIAGNFPASGDVVVTFAVYNPSNVTGIFVGGANYITNPLLPQGDRANPFPTITAALKAAAVGDRIEVLPGVYSEKVVLQPLVSIVSADVSSTDTNWVPGNALATVIRSPATTQGTATVAVSATDLTAFTNPTTGYVFQTELAGLTIASSLVGNPASGPINTASVGMQITDSNILVDKNYFIDSGTGIQVTTTAAGTSAPSLINDAVVGNGNGIVIQDSGSGSATATTNVINDTIAFNTNGILADNNSPTSARQAYIANSIFFQNHDQTTARSGYGIYSQTAGKLVLNNNMFSGNGINDTTTAYAAVNIGNGFNPALLGPLASNASANLGNYTGWPAFVSPMDPRPGGQGPAIFLNDANYGLQATSAAINNALESVAPTTDLLGNTQNPNPTTSGFHLPGYGPRDVGAFEYEPVGTVGTVSVGGAFRVVTTSLAPGGASQANGSSVNVYPAPRSIIIDFSQPVNKASVTATDLILSGSDLNALSPAKAATVTWLDSHTAQFNLAGSFNSSGTVNLSIPSGSILSVSGAPLPGYSDRVVLSSNAPVSTTPTSPTPTLPGPITPAPAPAPTAPPRKTKVTHRKVTPPAHKKVAVVHKPAQKVVRKPVQRVVHKPVQKVVHKAAVPAVTPKVVPAVAHKQTTVRKPLSFLANLFKKK